MKNYKPDDEQKPCTVCQKVALWVEKKPCICAECARLEKLEAALWEVARLTNEPGDADALLRRIDRAVRAALGQ